MAELKNNENIFDDSQAYNRIESASFAYFAIILLLAFATTYYRDYPEVILCIAAIKILIFMFRRIVNYKLKQLNESEAVYGRLLKLSTAGLYCSALVWSCFGSITFMLYGLALPTFIVFISAIGIISCAIFALSTSYRKARIFTGILIVPFVILSAFSGNENGLVVSILTFTYLLVIYKSMSRYYKWFNEKKNAVISLNNQACTLTDMNRKLRTEIHYSKTVEYALRTSEERYKTLFKNNPIATIIVDHDAKITGLNSAKKVTEGRIPQIGETMYKDYGSKHENDMYEELMDSMKTGCKKEFPEQKYNDRFLFIKISPFSGGAIITSLDITEQKNAEHQIQALTREIMTVQEKERKRISRDLHDSVAQELSTLRISCETFFDDIALENVKSVENKINNISSILHGSIQTVREIAYELRPPCLDEFGLGTTLFRYCEDYTSKTGIQVDFFSAGFEKIKIDPEVEINIYRLVQEALSNIKKHASASRVTLRFVASFPNIILRIEDNGLGFEKDLQEKTEKQNTRMGLRGMEERVLLFGGKFTIKTKPGKGTNIVVEVPVLKNENIQSQTESLVVMNT